MDGVLVVNKSKNCTSRDIVNKLNNIFHEKKIGHTGTLDPIATGVLVICLGRYTKLVDLLTSLDKEYICEMKLGVSTDTGDITGNVVDSKEVKIDKEIVIDVFNNFPKEYMQTVPIYSAVKKNGKKLYEYAREGKEIELPSRLVKIYNLELISIKDNVIKFKTLVSKGTYIRSLVNDVASKLNTIATMSSLERTRQGKFDITHSYSLEDILNNNYHLLGVTDVLDYPIIEIDKSNQKLFLNGNKVSMNIKDGKYFIKDKDIIAIYEFKNNLGRQIVKL